MDLNELFKTAVEKVVIPAIDIYVKQWNTPFQIDDIIWSRLREKILERVRTVSVVVNQYGYSINGTMASLDLKSLFKTFVATYLLPLVDETVRNWKTPFELDDKVWAFLRGKVLELISQIEFVQVSPGVFAVEDVR